MSESVSEMFYRAPWPRGPALQLPGPGRCIYCGRQPPDVELSDEHVIADGLGGGLIYAEASCDDCAKHTNSFEARVITQDLQWARAALGVRSRKRKSPPLTATIRHQATGLEEALPMAGGAPFFMIMPLTETLPGMLTGAPSQPDAKLRLGLFGDPDWVDQIRKWTGATNPVEFNMKYRSHVGVLGQLIAKTAHAYTCAKLGPDAFTPFLTDYILATTPAFDTRLMAICPALDVADDVLHQLTVNTAWARRPTAIGIAEEQVYVVGLRLFANRRSPGFIVVVGRPVGRPLPGIPALDLIEATARNPGKPGARSRATSPMEAILRGRLIEPPM